MHSLLSDLSLSCSIFKACLLSCFPFQTPGLGTVSWILRIGVMVASRAVQRLAWESPGLLAAVPSDGHGGILVSCAHQLIPVSTQTAVTQLRVQSCTL